MMEKQETNRTVIVVVNGYPRSGKDTFVEMASDRLSQLAWSTYSSSSIDFAKKITADAGIDEDPKTPEKRALWSAIKDAFEKYDRHASRMIMGEALRLMQKMTCSQQAWFIHAREPDAIEFMKSLAVDCEFYTVFVHRSAAERVTSNASDMGVEDFAYDFTINNESTLEDLQKVSRDFANLIIATKEHTQ